MPGAQIGADWRVKGLGFMVGLILYGMVIWVYTFIKPSWILCLKWIHVSYCNNVFNKTDDKYIKWTHIKLNSLIKETAGLIEPFPKERVWEREVNVLFSERNNTGIRL